jgi:hypothetical protein
MSLRQAEPDEALRVVHVSLFRVVPAILIAKDRTGAWRTAGSVGMVDT